MTKTMTDAAGDAIRITDKHLPGASAERRKALALDISAAIMRHASVIAAEVIDAAIDKTENLRSLRKPGGTQK